MSSLVSLSDDIWPQVLLSLYDRTDIRNCTLLCRTLHPAAQKALFKRNLLILTGYDAGPRNKVIEFYKILTGAEHVASGIRGLAISPGLRPAEHDDDAVAMAYILDKLVNVTYLHILPMDQKLDGWYYRDDCPWDLIPSKARDVLRTKVFPRLKRLEAVKFHDVDIRSLQSLSSSLAVLEITEHFASAADADTWAAVNAPPSLYLDLLTIRAGSTRPEGYAMPDIPPIIPFLKTCLGDVKELRIRPSHGGYYRGNGGRPYLRPVRFLTSLFHIASEKGIQAIDIGPYPFHINDQDPISSWSSALGSAFRRLSSISTLKTLRLECHLYTRSNGSDHALRNASCAARFAFVLQNCKETKSISRVEFLLQTNSDLGNFNAMGWGQIGHALNNIVSLRSCAVYLRRDMLGGSLMRFHDDVWIADAQEALGSVLKEHVQLVIKYVGSWRVNVPLQF
ncbi:hypothetical protein DL96DRAFT_1817980 [Flagelloscypha sp. PMI_526]|nr:hypothetical protein DL96DRAFT_1817980 [Flagelloscypha sp. PMI_526]